MFNQDRKERFVKENYDNVGTQKGLILTFRKTALIENQYQTDICEFNRNQMIDVFSSLDCASVESLNKERSKLNQYIKWCVAEGYCTPNLIIDSIYYEDIKKYVNHTAMRRQYINREELYTALKDVDNEQERAIPILLFEGAWGRMKKENAFEELRNLKAEDCVYPNKLTLWRDNGDSRDVSDIDKRSMDIIYAAINQTEYRYNNGMSESNLKAMPLEISPYVLRKVLKKNSSGKINEMAIETRIRNFKKFTDLYWLNAKNIFYSGMFDRLQNIEQQRELTNEDYMDIVNRFGMEDARWWTLKEKYSQYKQFSNKK